MQFFPRLARPKNPTRPNSATAALAPVIAPFRQLVSSRLEKTDRHSQKPIDRRDRFPLTQRLSG
jgi:hypothetical protein